MTTFDQAFTKLLGNEGGYSNNEKDPGGETNWGVTKNVAVANGYSGDMRDFTQEQAKVIYKKSYWDSFQADKLHPDIRFDVFDGAVNSGVSQSIKWLQMSVGSFPDGVMGPSTMACIETLPASVITSHYNGFRLEFMTNLKTWVVFGGGWAKRIANNLKGT